MKDFKTTFKKRIAKKKDKDIINFIYLYDLAREASIEILTERGINYESFLEQEKK